jgi:hypothetical protein
MLPDYPQSTQYHMTADAYNMPMWRFHACGISLFKKQSSHRWHNSPSPRKTTRSSERNFEIMGKSPSNFDQVVYRVLKSVIILLASIMAWLEAGHPTTISLSNRKLLYGSVIESIGRTYSSKFLFSEEAYPLFCSGLSSLRLSIKDVKCWYRGRMIICKHYFAQITIKEHAIRHN